MNMVLLMITETPLPYMYTGTSTKLLKLHKVLLIKVLSLISIDFEEREESVPNMYPYQLEKKSF